MSSFSPERALTRTMLSELAEPLAALNPYEYEASTHVSLSDDWDEDKALLGAGYNCREELIDDEFMDLVDFFDASFSLVTPTLCEQWSLDDELDMAYPEDDSQVIAKYYTEVNGIGQELTIAQWRQPSPYADVNADIMAVCLRSHQVSGSLSFLFYMNGEFLIGRRIADIEAGFIQTAWENGVELTPDDTMRIEKVVQNIPLLQIDTAP